MQICVLGRWVLPSPHLHHVGVALHLAAGGAGGTFRRAAVKVYGSLRDGSKKPDGLGGNCWGGLKEREETYWKLEEKGSLL